MSSAKATLGMFAIIRSIRSFPIDRSINRVISSRSSFVPPMNDRKAEGYICAAPYKSWRRRFHLNICNIRLLNRNDMNRKLIGLTSKIANIQPLVTFSMNSPFVSVQVHPYFDVFLCSSIQSY